MSTVYCKVPVERDPLAVEIESATFRAWNYGFACGIALGALVASLAWCLLTW